MKWTRATCARQRFGRSGDDKAARVIADSNKSNDETSQHRMLRDPPPVPGLALRAQNAIG